jgi:AcrR family transcriptional regulator
MAHKPVLSRQRIVDQAVNLLDSEGIDALSMRRLGTRLGSGATSIYTHVTSKDELLELAVDAVYGQLPVPDAAHPAGWRSSASDCAWHLRALILRHPWLVSVLGEAGLAYLGPHMMRLADGILTLFESAGFAAGDADHAMSALIAYVIGRCAGEAAWLRTVARSGESERNWSRRLVPYTEQATQSYPRLRRRYSGGPELDPGARRQDNFSEGLELLLDGIATRLRQPSATVD